MAGYRPVYIKGMETGLVQSRQEFILPNDAYPVLENAFVWRERIKRKQGFQLLGRLQRSVDSTGINIYNLLDGLEATSSLVPGTISIIGAGGQTWTDPGEDGVLIGNMGSPNSTVNYATGAFGGPILPLSAGTFSYYPGLPVMGIRSQELNAINTENTVVFDTKYAYEFVGTGFQEFITTPPNTWTGDDDDFFWSMNYWVTPAPSNNKLFWVTNFSGTLGDPIRYTDGSVWVNFAPEIDASGNKLQQCLAMVPFRGRMLVFNTLEGNTLGTSIAFTNRIRWAAIGNPISDISALFPTGADVNVNAWKDDIRGQGGFLNIPTSESIVAVGFVRDNLVIYCERSTWQLRYTGRSIAPFQIERVNSELGSESTFSAVQFDTSLVGIGDKGIVECDSFKSERIDIKIPDLVFEFRNLNNSPKRVHGIRDFQQRLAYWTYPFDPNGGDSVKFPNRRLVYNYENDSWAIFTDSLTTLGTFQAQENRTWDDDPQLTWTDSNFSWISAPALFPSIVGGNQQGFVLYLDRTTTNEESLTINNITGNTTTPTSISSVNHNLQPFQVIKISGIPAGTPFATSLNDNIFAVVPTSADDFSLYVYNPDSGQFDISQLDDPATYIGGGVISIRDNFSITSKKFNYLDDGQKIQIGYLDILMNSTSEGAISLFIYLDYDDSKVSNTIPENEDIGTGFADPFFNATIPTTSNEQTIGGVSNTMASKYWQRVICPTRSQFLTLEYTLSNAQLIGIEQESDVQIDSQILWMRPAGRLI